MLISDKDQFAAVMTEVTDFYKTELTVHMLERYWRLLGTYSLDQLKEAFNKHFLVPKKGNFMPYPSDVAFYIEGPIDIRGLLAWSKTISAIKTVGAYSSIIFDDPLIHLVITDMGGWISLCRTSDKQIPFSEQQFSKRYEAYVINTPLFYPNKLVGIIEHQNSNSESRIPSPILFGDIERAKSVYQHGSDLKLITYKHNLLLIDEKPQNPQALEQIDCNNTNN